MEVLSQAFENQRVTSRGGWALLAGHHRRRQLPGPRVPLLLQQLQQLPLAVGVIGKAGAAAMAGEQVEEGQGGVLEQLCHAVQLLWNAIPIVPAMPVARQQGQGWLVAR